MSAYDYKLVIKWFKKDIYTVSKNDTDVAHYNFNAHQPISTEDPISGVCVSPGSAETIVRRDGITYNHLITYSLSNISAKKSLKSVDVRWRYSVQCDCCFFETHCIAATANNNLVVKN